MHMIFSVNPLPCHHPTSNLFTCCCSHVSSCKINSFFNFELAVLCLQALLMCVNIHFDPLCWDNAISLKKSSRRDEVSNSERKILVVKNIPPSRDGITFAGNQKCFFLMAKTTVKPLYSGHHLDLEKVSTKERCPLHRCLSQIGLFCLKNPF